MPPERPLIDELAEEQAGGAGGSGKRGRSAHTIALAILEKALIPRDDAPAHPGFAQSAAGVVYRYNGRYWAEVSEDTLHAIVHAAEEKAKLAMRREVIGFLKVETHREDLSFGAVADHEVPVENGVIDVRTRQIRPHRPEDWLDSVLPVAFDPAAKCPVWETTLLDWFDDTDDRVTALQQFLGYICLAHARFKKALVLYGPGDTGKSLFALLAKAMVGEAFTCSLSVADMDEPMKRHVIVAKRLNIMTELPADALIADGGFKVLISTGEPVMINPKHERPYMYTPAAKHVIACNSLPSVTDRTEATFNRLLIVPYDRILPPEQQDRDRLAKLQAELPGILNWALDGARELLEAKGVFAEPGRAAAIKSEMREESNPVAQFVQERMKAEAKAATPLSDVTKAYNEWHQGGRRSNVRHVGKLLRAAGFETDDAWPVGGTRSAKCLIGWRLYREDELSLDKGTFQPPPS